MIANGYSAGTDAGLGCIWKRPDSPVLWWLRVPPLASTRNFWEPKIATGTETCQQNMSDIYGRQGTGHYKEPKQKAQSNFHGINSSRSDQIMFIWNPPIIHIYFATSHTTTLQKANTEEQWSFHRKIALALSTRQPGRHAYVQEVWTKE